jgi:tetratricopeptide (TPR) repeat protein
MTNRVAIPGCVAVLVLLAARPVAAQRQTIASVEAINSWVEAVNAHVPGRPDAPVGAVIAMTYVARRDLNTAMPLFIRVLREREVAAPLSGINNPVVRPADKIISLARKVRRPPGAETFLKRAAVLHSDAVVFASRFPSAPDDAPWRPPSNERIAGVQTPIPAERVAPLLTSDRVTLTRDGEVFGDAPVSWHLPFARSLLAELLRREDHILSADECARDEACRSAALVTAPRISFPTPPVSAADQEFVGEWYHAVAAYLFAKGMNGDATAHLQEAARALPDEPRLLFDRATYAETLGLPLYQAVQDSASTKPKTFIARIPAEDKVNAEAERLYRRALEVDAGYLEARVRLARLLDRRGQHDEAAAQIAKVLEPQPSGVVGFYARIVGGRVATARRRYDEALQHYRAASRLYPAQSASLGASHAALMLADVPRTLAPIEDLGMDPMTFDADPWLDYHLGAGRDVNALMARLWTDVSK